MKIRESKNGDFKDMMEIARKLHPKWFDKFATNVSMPIDLKIHKGFVAEDKGKLIGFITYFSEEGQVKISWIGVHPKFQRKNIGSKLLKALEEKLKRYDVKELRVKTVAATTKYGPYDRLGISIKRWALS